MIKYIKAFFIIIAAYFAALIYIPYSNEYHLSCKDTTMGKNFYIKSHVYAPHVFWKKYDGEVFLENEHGNRYTSKVTDNDFRQEFSDTNLSGRFSKLSLNAEISWNEIKYAGKCSYLK